jgi:hypothetical protein
VETTPRKSLLIDRDSRRIQIRGDKRNPRGSAKNDWDVSEVSIVRLKQEL